MIVCKSLYFYPSSELCHCLLRRMYTLNSAKQLNKKFPVNCKNSPRNQRKAICRENLSLEYYFVGGGHGGGAILINFQFIGSIYDSVVARQSGSETERMELLEGANKQGNIIPNKGSLICPSEKSIVTYFHFRTPPNKCHCFLPPQSLIVQEWGLNKADTVHH